MILTLDIGNTNIVIGGFSGDTLLFTERMASDLHRTVLEYSFTISHVLELYQIPLASLEGIILSSVVPPLTETLRQVFAKMTDAPLLIVGENAVTDLPLCMDHPSTVGSDLIVDAVAAKVQYGCPVIVIDMGTATTLSIVAKDGSYVGTIILAGARIALDSLVSGTAQLPHIGLTVPERVIADNTVDSMRSGLIYGSAACLDGMIDRIWAELGYETQIVATGGLAAAVVPHCTHEILLNDALLLQGLKWIYDRNRREFA